MTLKYFQEQIKEELDGAREYIDKAIEVKPKHRSWSVMFAKMADMEADHAENLMFMLEECIRTKDYLEPVDIAMDPNVLYKDLMKDFGETMTYVTNMKRGL